MTCAPPIRPSSPALTRGLMQGDLGEGDLPAVVVAGIDQDALDGVADQRRLACGVARHIDLDLVIERRGRGRLKIDGNRLDVLARNHVGQTLLEPLAHPLGHLGRRNRLVSIIDPEGRDDSETLGQPARIQANKDIGRIDDILAADLPEMHGARALSRDLPHVPVSELDPVAGSRREPVLLCPGRRE